MSDQSFLDKFSSEVDGEALSNVPYHLFAKAKEVLATAYPDQEFRVQVEHHGQSGSASMMAKVKQTNATFYFK